jgi:uncharacterized protein (DUF427 family)
MAKAVWNGQVIAEAVKTQQVDGYTYFPREAVRWEFLSPSTSTSVCPWKGTATYFNITANGQPNPAAAWSYEAPKSAAAHIKNHVGFWRGVEILE